MFPRQFVPSIAWLQLLALALSHIKVAGARYGTLYIRPRGLEVPLLLPEKSDLSPEKVASSLALLLSPKVAVSYLIRSNTAPQILTVSIFQYHQGPAEKLYCGEYLFLPCHRHFAPENKVLRNFLRFAPSIWLKASF